MTLRLTEPHLSTGQFGVDKYVLQHGWLAMEQILEHATGMPGFLFNGQNVLVPCFSHEASHLSIDSSRLK